MTDDPRDPRMAERLRVEPLDEVTRARLVRAAMAEVETAPEASTTWASRARVLGIAAVLVALLAVGLAVVLRDDSGSGPTAADAPNPTEAQDHSRSGSTDALDERPQSLDFQEFSVGASLGDLGDVGSAAKLRRAVTATPVAIPAAPAAGAPTAANQSAPTLATPNSKTTTCGTDAVDRLGTRVGTGTGTVDGEPVTVYVVERPDGTRVAVVVGADCVAGKPVTL